MKFGNIGPVVSEEKSFESVDGRRRTTEASHPISFPGAVGLGELKLDICVQRTRIPPSSALSKMAPWLRYWLLSDNYRSIKADFLDVARCYLWLFTLYINIKISKNSC